MSEKTGSRLLYPYKIVGLVCGNTRLSMNQLGTETFFTVPVKRAFQVYDAAKLQMVMCSPQLDEDILALEADREYTYTAVGGDVLKWKRFTVVGKMVGEHGKIACLSRVGDYLLSASEDGFLCVWNGSTLELINTINLGSSFHPSMIIHPDTYINKVLIASTSGQLQLWNIRSSKLIMSFKGYPCGITYMQQSPSVDVVAIGLEDGTTDILNLKYDQSVMQFQQSSAVTGISFFSNMAKVPIMITAGQNGHIYIWNIKEKRLHFEVEDAHEGSIHSLFFIQNEMQFLSGGCDNSLRIWSLDEVDFSARVLKSREGHTTSSNKIQFYGFNSVIAREDSSDGMALNILSAGLDRAFRNFHVIREQLGAELSQAPYAKRVKNTRVIESGKRLPVIINFAYSEGRDRDWSNVVSCHEKTVGVYCWRYLDRTMTNHVLVPPEGMCEGNYAMCCDVGNQGESVVVGYRDGLICV